MNRDELYYDVARHKTEEQDKRRQHFDTMATAILGLSSALIGVIAFTASKWACWSIYPAIGALVSFGGVAMSTILVLWLREWEFQPPLAGLYNHMGSGEYEDEALVIWTAKQMASAIKNNNDNSLRYKAVWLRVTYVCLALEAIALGILVFSVAV